LSATPIDAVARVHGIPKRHLIVFFAFSCTLINVVDRVNLSVVAPLLGKEHGWNAVMTGTVLSAFFWGYTASPIIGGWLADRLGGKRVLGFGALWWSLCTFLTPFGGGASGLMALRVLLGLGEGINSPAIQSIAARWLPLKERTRSVAFYLTGSPIGTVIAFPLTTGIVIAWGWPFAFYVYGIAGFVWLLFWMAFGADSPETHRTISAAEREYIVAERRLPEAHEGVPWRKLLRTRAVWGLIIMTFSVAWMVWLFLSWLPYYLMTAQHFSLKQSGFYSALPFLSNMLGGVGAGWLQDRFIAGGAHITLVRKVTVTVASVLTVIFLLTIAATDSPTVVVWSLVFAMAIFAANQGTVMVNNIDIGPRHAGVILGLQATAGNLAGAISPVVAGIIVQATGSFRAVFYLIAVVLAVGVIAWDLLSSGERVID
jgi:ACS family sodium-dependent inorganic phosphate cotransporter